MIELHSQTLKENINISETVEKLLNDRTYHIEFNGHLTNHAKHAVVALSGLGVDDQKIKLFYKNHAKKTAYGYGLELAQPSRHIITIKNWKTYLGKRTSFSAYIEFFENEEKILGIEGLLQKYLPTLIHGWPGAFTHAAIHTGWGLSVKNKFMTIEGLAYMAFTYVPCKVEKISAESSNLDLTPMASIIRIAGYWENNETATSDWIKASQDESKSEIVKKLHPELKRSGLQYRIACMLEKGHPLFYDTPKWMNEKDSSELWSELYYMAAILYLSTPGDFIVLHLITSLYAMEKIANSLPKEEQKNVLACYWVGLLGILFSKNNFPKKEKLESLYNLYCKSFDNPNLTYIKNEWQKTITRATEEEEEHNPKLVYVSKQVWDSNNHKTIFRDVAAQFTKTPELPKSFDIEPIKEIEYSHYFHEIYDNGISNYNENIYILPQTNYLKSLHTSIRDTKVSRTDFIFFAKKIITQLIEKSIDLLPTVNSNVKTPIGEIYEGIKVTDNVCGVSIMRAGESMEIALREIIRSINIGKILIQRDKITKLPHIYYTSLPSNISQCHVLLMDPMLATGGTALAAIKILIENGVMEENIIFVNILTVSKGINSIHSKYPKIRIVTSAVDSKLNDNAYMVPGIGDFGDRYFGTDF